MSEEPSLSPDVIDSESSGQHPRASQYPFLTGSQRCDTFAKANIYLSALYFVIGISVIEFDLGANDYGKMLAEFGQSVIPSIRPTSQISSKPESAAVVLSISWIWGIVISLPLLWLLAKDGRGALNLAFLKRTFNPLKIVFIWTLIPVGLFVFASESPDKLAQADGYIMRCLEATPYSMVLWGIVIFSPLSVAFYMASISLVCALTNNIEDK